MNHQEFISQIKKEKILKLDNTNKEDYPALMNISSGFFFKYLPNPIQRKSPEFIYIGDSIDEKKINFLELAGAICYWNIAWESGHYRYDIISKDEEMFAKKFDWLSKYKNSNIYLLPYLKGTNFYSFQTILNLLPARTRMKFNLPLFKRGIWPTEFPSWYLKEILPQNFDSNLSKAFAYHIWPLLNNSSDIKSFNKDESIVLLAHNLNFWIPLVNQLIEKRLLNNDLEEYESFEEQKKVEEMNKKIISSSYYILKPRYGGYIWCGEDEAWEFTKELINHADKVANLRNIIDAIKSNRIQDDFSNKWSYAKEDFERKLYNKRSKYKVTFIEISDTIPVIGPETEVENNLFWENFLGILNEKEKRIVVCLRNGTTKLKDISKLLGYANHSPISKALTQIRIKAKRLLDS